MNFASFGSESVDQAVEKYSLQKITLLREISIKTGIQVMLLLTCSFPWMTLCGWWSAMSYCFGLSLQILIKEYNFDSRHKPAFTEEDILNIFPVVKHVNPKASDAFHFFQSGQAKVQQGNKNDLHNNNKIINWFKMQEIIESVLV